MNSVHTDLTYQRAKRHAAWLLADAEDDEEAARRARARRSRRRGRLYRTVRHHDDRPYVT
jgi:hypothetical protein